MRKCLFVLSLLALGLFFGTPAVAFAQENNDTDADQQVKVYIPFIFIPGQPGTEVVDDTVVDKSVVRIYLDDARQLHELAHDLDLFEEPTTNGYAVALASAEEVAALRAQGVRVESDAVRTSELRSAQAEVLARSGEATNAIPGYACYRTVEETYTTFANLATSRPTLATWTDIGNSWEKVIPGGKAGYDVYALKLTNSAKPGPKPKFLLMSAIHAREYATAELATRFVEDLVNKYNNNDPDATWLLDNFELHVIPQANPDGRKMAEAGQLWRKNTDNDDGCRRSTTWGTDLNRNSSFKWNTGGSSSNACNETYRGPGAASEPETQAIETYARSIFADQRGPLDTDAAPVTAEGLFITLHSYGQLVLYPWGWTTSPAPNSTQLQTLGRKFGFFTGYQVCNGPACLYATSGTTDDMVYGERGIASYTFEIGTAFFQSCTTFTSDILPKNLPALTYAFKAARRPYQSPSGPEALSLTVSPASVPAGTSITLNATLNDTRYNSNGWGTEPSQTIQAGRYTIDTPSWTSSVTTYPLSAVDSSFNASIENVRATINTSGLSAGRHTIFVEGQDVNGNWGVPTAIFITIN